MKFSILLIFALSMLSSLNAAAVGLKDLESALEKATTDLRNNNNSKVDQEESEPNKVTKSEQTDGLVAYFKNFNQNTKPNQQGKNGITFAGIGAGVSYETDFIDKLCTFSNQAQSVTTISGESFAGTNINNFCKNKPHILPEYPRSNSADQDQWKQYYLKHVRSYTEIDGEDVGLSVYGNSMSFVVQHIVIEGVKFAIKFKFKKIDSQKAILGMLKDKSIPLTYFSYFQEGKPKEGIIPATPAEWKRHVSRFELTEIQLIPLDYDAYRLKIKEIKQYFVQKYPGKVSEYGDGDNSIMLNTAKLSQPITYLFDRKIHNKKYIQIYNEAKKKELSGVENTSF